MTIMQGDSYPIMISLTHDGDGPLVPEILEDVEITISNAMSLLMSEGGVYFDAVEGCWYIHPTQEQTFALEPGLHELSARVKYQDAPDVVVGIQFDAVLRVLKSHSRRVL